MGENGDMDFLYCSTKVWITALCLENALNAFLVPFLCFALSLLL